MPTQIPGSAVTVIDMNLALFGTTPGNAVYLDQLAVVGENNTNLGTYSAQIINANFAGTGDADLATTVLGKLLGEDPANTPTLHDALTNLLATNEGNRGLVVYQLAQLLTGLESSPIFGPAAKVFNNEIINGYYYAISPSSVVPVVPYIPYGFAGQVFVLTTGLDAFTGTTGSETFIGTEATLSAGDAMAGNGGNDALLYSTSGSKPITTPGFTTTGIQTFRVTSDAIGGTNVDISGMLGVTALFNDNSSTTVAFYNVGTLISLTNLNVSAGDTQVNYRPTLVQGRADTMSITLNNDMGFQGGATGLIQADGIESFNITTTGGASNIADIKSNTLQSVVIQGTANLTLHSLSFTNPGGTNNVSAADLTGKLDLTLGSNTTTTLINGGHNTDTLHFSGNQGDYLVTVVATNNGLSTFVHDQRISLLPVGDVRLTNVERLAFHDQGLALDMNIGQAGGKAVVLLAEALGAAYLQDKSFVAKALAYFDSGASLQDGANLLLASGTVAALAGGSSNAALVGFVYHNVFGMAPDAATLALLQAPLDNHSLTQAQWLAAVAQIGVVQDQVHLAGYAQTGLGYAL